MPGLDADEKAKYRADGYVVPATACRRRASMRSGACWTS